MISNILSHCSLSENGRTLTIPSEKDYKVSREDYSAFKQSLLNIKAEWVGNQQFQFPYNAKNVIEKMKAGEIIDFRKLQLFPTPIDLAGYMWDCLTSEFPFPVDRLNELKVLEPSAGTGNLIKYLRNCGLKEIDYCEICPEYEDILKAETNGIKTNKVETNFLDYQPSGLYDLVFANPPFASDTKHFKKMLECVKPGGYVCTLMGESFYPENSKDEFESFTKKYGVKQWFCTGTPKCDPKDKDSWIFEGTPSGYSLLVVRKPFNPFT